MYTEDFAVDNSAESHKVEDLTACLPDRCVAVFLHTFFIEAVDLGDLARFVVAADESHTVWVSRTEAMVNRGRRGWGRVLTSLLSTVKV